VLAFGPKCILQALIEVVNVGLRIESSEGSKIGAAIGIVEEVIQLEAIALEDDFSRDPAW
jgi:hypothetical protein